MSAMVAGNAPALMRAVADALAAPVFVAIDEEGVAQAAAALGGPLDLLVVVTGPTQPDTLHDLSDADLSRVLVDGVGRAAGLTRDFAAQAPAPGRDDDGPVACAQVIHVIDQPLQTATPLHTSLALGAAAIAALVRIGAQQFAPAVRVNAIAPAHHVSRMRESALEASLTATESRLLPAPGALRDAIAYLVRSTSVTGRVLTLQTPAKDSVALSARTG